MITDALVSVIIPFHNRVELLDEAIMSVVQQTYSPIEILLVDDSSDEQIPLDRYERIGVSIKYVRNHKNVGPAMSRFVGLDQSKGQCIVFLDSDDILAPTFVEKQLRTLNNGGDPAFAYCFTKLFDQTGILGDRGVEQVQVTRILPDIMTHGRVWCTSACLWNRKYLLSIERFGGYQWEDYRLDITMGLIHNVIACTPDYLCFYRVDSSKKLSRDDAARNSRLLESIQGILQSLKKSGANFEGSAKVERRLLTKYVGCLSRIERGMIFDGYHQWLAGFLAAWPSLAWFQLTTALPFFAKRMSLKLLRRQLGKTVRK